MTIGEPLFYPCGPITIRDGTAARVATVPGLAHVFKARTMPTKDEQKPYAVVWNAGEKTEPSGDGNTGAPFFLHTMTLIVDVMIDGSDDTSLDASIVNLVETIRATLLTDPSWIDLFEGIHRCDTRYSYPKESEGITAEAMIEIEVTYRSEWPPYLPNTLSAVAVAPAPKGALDGFTTQIQNLDT